MTELESMQGFVLRRKQYFASLENLTADELPAQSETICDKPVDKKPKQAEPSAKIRVNGNYTSNKVSYNPGNYSGPKNKNGKVVQRNVVMSKWKSMSALDDENDVVDKKKSENNKPLIKGNGLEQMLKPHWTVLFSQRMNIIRQKFESKSKHELVAQFQPSAKRPNLHLRRDSRETSPSTDSGIQQDVDSVQLDGSSVEGSESRGVSSPLPPPPVPPVPSRAPTSSSNAPPSPPLPPPPSPLALLEARSQLTQISHNVSPSRRMIRPTKSPDIKILKSRYKDIVPKRGVISPGIQGRLEAIVQQRSEAPLSPIPLKDVIEKQSAVIDYSKWFSEGHPPPQFRYIPSPSPLNDSLTLTGDLANGDGFKVNGGVIDGFTGDEKIPDKVTLKDWDPTKLLKDLYKVELIPDDPPPKHNFINMEGYMEKLPINKKKATLLKTWKRRFFRAKDGFIYYAEDEADEVESDASTHSDRSSGFMQLSGGTVEEIGPRMIGIDDGRGRYLVLRCPTDLEFTDWMTSLKSQTAENYKAMYVKPVLTSPPHKRRKVVIVDIGSCSVRAGILGEKPSLPQLFFPAIMATDKDTGKHYFGFDALKPEIRANCLLSYPVRPSVKVDQAALDMDSMPLIFEKIFNDLHVDPSEYWLMFSTPGNFSDKIKKFMDMLINRFHIVGANIINQSLLSLYSYNASSGIVVDIGERLEIVPVTDGYIAEAGVTRQPYGGHRITESLNSSFTESRYRFFTDVEFQIVRLAMEQTCYVAENYNEEMKKVTKNPGAFAKSVDLSDYELPPGSWTTVKHDVSRFKSPEGLFDMDLWGMDNPPLHKLVLKAVQACPMDTRREMWRSIFLSGGVTLMPGFAQRLNTELEKLVPPTIKIEIHASPQRYHSAYIGACTMANLNVFEQACISATEWQKDGVQALKKWHMY